MQQYLQMKDSGIEWIGKIPEHWVLINFGKICRLRQGLQIAQQERFWEGGMNRLPYITIRSIHEGSSNQNKEYIENPPPRVICNPDDVLLARTGATGEVVTNQKGVFHNNFFLIDYNRAKIERDFLVCYLTNSQIKERVLLLAGTTTVPDLNHDDFLRMPFLLPPYEEQKLISQFITKETSKLDSEIQKNQELIELLKEKRRATINQAVTKGLDPTVPMKDSGMEWIGKIPEHWEINKIKHCAYVKGRVGWQGLRSDEFIDEGPYLITGTDFEDGKINWNKCYHISEWRYEQDPFIQVKKNDLLITKDGTIGKLAYLDEIHAPATLNSHLLVLRPLNNEFTNRFLYWVFNADYFNYYVNLAQTGTTFYGISQEKIENFIFTLPNINEQKSISKFLDENTKRLDVLINKTQSQIEKLQEYHQSLISAAVTGKIDVRKEVIVQ